MLLDKEERRAAVFGVFDGLVGHTGLIFGLLLGHAPGIVIALGGVGGAVSNTVSMGTGSYESEDSGNPGRLRNAIVMALATLVGTMTPVWPFFAFARSLALIAGGIGALVIATWIGYEKRRGWRGYCTAYLILLAAIGATLAVVSLIPASA
jgi:VIT1/CCC1 family predicted Fe2+/Mn2+ transporter